MLHISTTGLAPRLVQIKLESIVKRGSKQPIAQGISTSSWVSFAHVDRSYQNFTNPLQPHPQRRGRLNALEGRVLF